VTKIALDYLEIGESSLDSRKTKECTRRRPIFSRTNKSGLR